MLKIERRTERKEDVRSERAEVIEDMIFLGGDWVR